MAFSDQWNWFQKVNCHRLCNERQEIIVKISNQTLELSHSYNEPFFKTWQLYHLLTDIHIINSYVTKLSLLTRLKCPPIKQKPVNLTGFYMMRTLAINEFIKKKNINFFWTHCNSGTMLKSPPRGLSQLKHKQLWNIFKVKYFEISSK